MAVLSTIENSILSHVSESMASLKESVQSNSNEELWSQIIALEKQIRLNTIEESRRMYELLKEQQASIELEVRIFIFSLIFTHSLSH